MSSRIAVLFLSLAISVPSLAGETVKDSGRAHCDLGKFQRLPALLLIGENHCRDSSTKVKDEMTALGAEGKIFAAFEAADMRVVYPWNADLLYADFGAARTERSRIFGIDSPFAHGLAISYGYASGTASICAKDPHKDSFARFIKALRNNPYLQRSWEEVRDAPLSAEDSGLAGLLNAIEEARTSSEDISRAASQPLSEEGYPSFLRIAARVNARYVAMANERYLPDLGLTDRLTPYPEIRGPWALRKILPDWSFAQADDAKITVPVRNRDMFDNIADIYCLAAAEGKNMAVSMGADHVPGVEGYLRRWSGDAIPLKAERSFVQKLPDDDLSAAGPVLEALSALSLASPQGKALSPALPKKASSLDRFDFSSAENNRR
ncbi:MAG: hypothetical protein WCU88_05230 [Elusimicrobiota bacterium]